jgi:predicted N-acyltransferase
VPIVIEGANGRAAAVAPAYAKSHSQGEYVFDHGWADAWQNAGGEYYPKVQLAVPFTPVPGPRLLGTRSQHLLAAIEAVTTQNGMSSAHITFVDDAGAAEAERRGWLTRFGIQYHWHNRGYAGFDDFLGALSSRKRKAIRKERAAAQEGLEFRTLRGTEITTADWDAMWAFYQDTGSRKWGRPYLTRSFFDLLAQRLGDAVLLMFACHDGRPIAGALNLIGADTLYGRYWGTVADVPNLHFEICYYQAIEAAIARGLAKVEAGAQGQHKLSRGYRPVPTWSAHFIPDPNFRRAVADFLAAERPAVIDEIGALDEMAPFRKDRPDA